MQGGFVTIKGITDNSFEKEDGVIEAVNQEYKKKNKHYICLIEWIKKNPQKTAGHVFRVVFHRNTFSVAVVSVIVKSAVNKSS